VLGGFFLLLMLGIGILYRLSYGDGELGSFKREQLGAYEDAVLGEDDSHAEPPAARPGRRPREVDRMRGPRLTAAPSLPSNL